jgi:predicted acetyltransferase
MSIKQNIYKDATSAGQVMTRTVDEVCALDKRLNEQQKVIDKMEKIIKDQNKILIKLSNSIRKLELDQTKKNSNIRTDMNDLRSDLRSLANRKNK